MFLLFSDKDEWCRSFATIDELNAEIKQYVDDQEEILHFKMIDISNAKKINIDIKWSE